MKTTLRAAMFALSIGGTTPAMAATEVPDMTTLVPAQTDPGMNTAKQSHAVPGHDTWLFPPIGKYLNRQTWAAWPGLVPDHRSALVRTAGRIQHSGQDDAASTTVTKIIPAPAAR